MMFYLVFALTLTLQAKARTFSLSLVLITIVAIGQFLPLASQEITAQSPIYFYTRPIILEFLAGIYLALIYLQRTRRNILLGYTLVSLSIIMFAGVHAGHLSFSSPAIATASTLLVFGFLELEDVFRKRAIAAFLYLGNSSYSIYIWHTFAISVVAKVCEKLSINMPLAFIAAVTSGTIIGFIGYETMEKPLMAYFKKRVDKEKRA